MEAVMSYAWDSLCIFCRAAFGGFLVVFGIACIFFLSKMVVRPAPYNSINSRGQTHRVGGRRR